MKGDFTRFRFDPAQHRRRVYEQQGRVAVDADANESVDVAEYLRQVGIRDVVGPSGGPLAGAGFAITAAGGDLKIGTGRYWVDGLLVENESAATSLAAQPYLPAGTSPLAKTDGTPGSAPNDGVYLVFLETWERIVTAAEDDSLREPALGGPDTTTRTQQVWQTRLLRAGNLGTPFSCSANLADWTTLTSAPAVTMAARSAVSSAPPNDCTVPADAGYRGTENQHYRVEIHDSGTLGNATFVWSRENGSVVTRWTDASGNDLTVSSPGRDGSLGFAPGDWVELIDETHELIGTPGTLVQLHDARGDHLIVDPSTATGSLDRAQFPSNPRVRRWDADGPQTVRVPSSNGGWLPLEFGVEVHFASGSFKTGQWWAVPARTVLGDVIWPQSSGTPATQTPFGEQHHFARLAVAQLQAGAWSVLADCRQLFPPLTGLESLFALGGDGQEALPDVTNPATLVPLAVPLRVGVAIGKTPVAQAPVRFQVTAGSGQVNSAASVVVPTGADGVATVSWSVDSKNALQTVTAQLVDDLGTPFHLPVQFDASLSVAADVAYDPKACADLAGATTVQQALDKLCATGGGGGCATIVVSPGDNWEAPLVALAAGAHAHICFRPGTYTAQQPVVLESKGSLIISGAGLGSRVVAPASEVALLFRDCDEVVVRDLAVESGVVGLQPERPGINGALTLEGCRRVVVESVELKCAAGAARAGACLTARASAKNKPESVRVRDCDLVVGHMQIGALVLDTQTTSVSGTTIHVAPATVAFDTLLADADRRGALVRQLIGRAKAADTPTAAGSGFNTLLKAGSFTVAFDSSVPQTEWQQLAAQHPPAEADLVSKQSVQQWATNLAQQAISTPHILPTFSRNVLKLQRQLGESFSPTVESAAGRALLQATLVAGPISVLAPAGARAGAVRTIQLGSASVQCESVLSEADWHELLAAGGVMGAASGAALKAAMTTLARRALTDAGLRGKVPALGAWYKSLADHNIPVASGGVVVGGGTADSIVVDDNDLVGIAEAVHIGVKAGSYKTSGSRRGADRVEITGNRAAMRVPFELLQGPRAYFVGNTAHAVVADNEMRLDPAGKFTRPDAMLEGVRVWGVLGPLVRVDDNLLAGCATGVRIQPQPGTPSRVRWNASGNVAPDAGTAVVAPATVTSSNNVP